MVGDLNENRADSFGRLRIINEVLKQVHLCPYVCSRLLAPFIMTTPQQNLDSHIFRELIEVERRLKTLFPRLLVISRVV